MALYVVLHHRMAPHPKWPKDKWLNDNCIEQITTDPVTADLCRQAEIIYIHRCGWKRIPPLTSCSVRVAGIDGPPDCPTVHFKDAVFVGKPVGKRLYGIEKPHYEAPTPK